MLDYLPVLLSVDHPYPKLEQWVIDRFEMLNQRQVHVIRRADLPACLRKRHPVFAKAWLWDIVPADTQRLFFFDYDIIPLRALPELPDAPFAAARDLWVQQEYREYSVVAESGTFFNSGVFLARRAETVSVLAELKQHLLLMRDSAIFAKGSEQTPLNLIVQARGLLTELPLSCNTGTYVPAVPADDVAMLHLYGIHGVERWGLMHALKGALEMRML